MEGMDKLKSLLGDDADEKISSVLSALGNGESTQLPQQRSGADIETIMQIKGLIDNLGMNSSDSRSMLLMALKPYLRESRQHSIDSAVKLLNLSKLSGLFRMM